MKRKKARNPTTIRLRQEATPDGPPPHHRWGGTRKVRSFIHQSEEFRHIGQAAAGAEILGGFSHDFRVQFIEFAARIGMGGAD